MKKRVWVSMVCWLFLLVVAWVSGSPATNPSSVIDNPRVTVWDLNLKPGDSRVLSRQDLDVVNVYLSGGQVSISSHGQPLQKIKRAAFDVAFEAAGSEKDERVAGDRPLHVLQIGLKKFPSPQYTQTGSYPLAFPRPGSKNIFENARVIVWSYTWTLGAHTPTHFHNKDVVVAYLGDGMLDSVPVDGKSETTHHTSGEIRFNKANRTHYEVLESGHLSAVIVELK
jgi:hypothetical protein